MLISQLVHDAFSDDSSKMVSLALSDTQEDMLNHFSHLVIKSN